MAVAGAASDKKALDISILDMRKVPSVCDYFVIASGTSTTQVRAISDNIVEKLRDRGERVWHSEGEREALWVLLDYGDVVAHVFQKDTRRFYELEKLWGKVPSKKFIDSGRKVRKAKRPKPAKKAKKPKGRKPRKTSRKKR